MFGWLKRLFGLEKREKPKELPAYDPEEEERNLAAKIEAEVRKPLRTLRLIKSDITSAVGTTIWKEKNAQKIAITYDKRRERWRETWEDIALRLAAFNKRYHNKLLRDIKDKLSGPVRKSYKTKLEWLQDNLSKEIAALVQATEKLSEYADDPKVKNVGYYTPKVASAGKALLMKVKQFDKNISKIIESVDILLA